MREVVSVRGIDTIKRHKSSFQRWASMCICLPVSPQQYTVQTHWAASWVASTHQWSREEDALYGSGNTIHHLLLSKLCSDCPAAQQNQANKPQCTNYHLTGRVQKGERDRQEESLWSTMLLTASEEKRTEKERGRRESAWDNTTSAVLQSFSDSCGPKQLGLGLMSSDSEREKERERQTTGQKEREDMFPSTCFWGHFFAHNKCHNDNTNK